ncbi:SRPBCC family protein [Robiginitalea aurantiaca]|uniref:SRPBCC family protein n=1 Tax=Robiginitalea aurantiaca TaxID=3056915 RepID=A0ABT7WCT6_9FLAO|nr:SRPBCC family protein [Robiginitalea aurantiaca]MDM9630735.1 SRPBCC family protein [Robiginitalea aurantiaca]
MTYTTKIDIELPREKVVNLLEDTTNFKHWQRGLQSLRPISGLSGEEGAQVELEYLMGKRQLVMIETIIKKNFPEQYHLTYDAKGVHNIQKNYFEELGEAKCRWTSETEFQFSGLPMKLMGWLMPGMFKKQSLTYMKDFKAFAEKGTSVTTS